jgi:hypothetical protein
MEHDLDTTHGRMDALVGAQVALDELGVTR